MGNLCSSLRAILDDADCSLTDTVDAQHGTSSPSAHSPQLTTIHRDPSFYKVRLRQHRKKVSSRRLTLTRTQATSVRLHRSSSTSRATSSSPARRTTSLTSGSQTMASGWARMTDIRAPSGRLTSTVRAFPSLLTNPDSILVLVLLVVLRYRRLAVPREWCSGQLDAPLGGLYRSLPLHLGVPHRRQARGVQRGRHTDRLPDRAAHGFPECDSDIPDQS